MTHAHTWFVIALVAAVFGVLIDAVRKDWGDAITCAVVGLLAVAFVVQTHS